MTSVAHLWFIWLLGLCVCSGAVLYRRFAMNRTRTVVRLVDDPNPDPELLPYYLYEEVKVPVADGGPSAKTGFPFVIAEVGAWIFCVLCVLAGILNAITFIKG